MQVDPSHWRKCRNTKGVRNVFGLSFHNSFLHVYPVCATASPSSSCSPPPQQHTHEPGSLQHYTKVSFNSLENLNLYKTVCSVVAPGEQRAPKSMTRNTPGFRINCNSFDFHKSLERNFFCLLFARSITEHLLSLLPLTSHCFIFVLVFTWASLFNKVFNIKVLVIPCFHERASKFQMHSFSCAERQVSDLTN